MSDLPRMGINECRAIVAARRAEILRMLLLGLLLAATCALAMLLASITPVIGSTFTMPPAPPEQDIVPALWLPSATGIVTPESP